MRSLFRGVAIGCVAIALTLLAIPAYAASTTTTLPPLNGAQSGARNTGSRINFFRVAGNGVIPSQLPAGSTAVFTATLASDQAAGTWSTVGGIYEVGFTADPANFSTNFLLRDGIAFQDNTNGLGFCWDDYETVSSSGFGSAQCGYPDSIGGSLTRFTLTLRADGSFDMQVEHLSPAGAVLSTQSSSDPALRGFSASAPMYPYFRGGIGSDTGAAWSFEVTNASLTTDSAALFPAGAVTVAEAPVPPPAPRCADMVGEQGTTIIAGSASGSVNESVFCRQIVRNGQFLSFFGSALTGIANLGSTYFVETGVQQAVDVFAPGGQTRFESGMAVCLKGIGQFAWAPASSTPRIYGLVESYLSPDFESFSCVTVFEPGTLVLTGQTTAEETGAATAGSTTGGALPAGPAQGSSDPIQ